LCTGAAGLQAIHVSPVRQRKQTHKPYAPHLQAAAHAAAAKSTPNHEKAHAQDHLVASCTAQHPADPAHSEPQANKRHSMRTCFPCQVSNPQPQLVLSRQERLGIWGGCSTRGWACISTCISQSCCAAWCHRRQPKQPRRLAWKQFRSTGAANRLPKSAARLGATDVSLSSPGDWHRNSSGPQAQPTDYPGPCQVLSTGELGYRGTQAVHHFCPTGDDPGMDCKEGSSNPTGALWLSLRLPPS